MTLVMLGRDICCRHTDTDGKTYVQQHRVWDVGLFMAARTADAQKLNAEVKGGGKRLAKCEQITADQYAAERSK